ncbi:hypothetical protein AB6A40_011259 [Gnathostoma spinigerum]|uniref:RING-type domain-containing protein n=1 Tax=Gnathostoma spinigerum TaxID=75299 RepID=A0ABD6EYM0_9BILA
MSVPNKARIKTSTPSAEMLDTGDAPRRPPGHGCSSRSSAIPPPIKCVDHRKYADVVVQTFTNPGTASSSKHIPTASSSNHLDSLHRAASGSSVISNALRDFDSLSFFSAFIRCQELLKFISPYSSYIRELRVVQGVAANQYMVIIRFKTHADLWHFYDDCEGTSYNGIEPDRCSLLFVQKLETVGEAESINPWIEGLKELPTCPVCLERLDDQTITILCNHTFHPTCLEQWSDTTCPVCRYCLTPEVTPSLKCSDCDRRTDLWICLICGNIGCGRYAEAHAYQSVSHPFLIWKC